MSKIALEDIGAYAVAAFKEGNNCAESILHAFNASKLINIPPESIRLASCFGAGIGKSRDFCGALSGSVMVLSYLVGRADCREKTLPGIYKLSNDLHQRFSEHFHSTSCKELMTYEFGTREHLKNCLVITKESAILLAEFLAENQLIEL